MFFEEGKEDRGSVLVAGDVSDLSAVLADTPGVECFVSNAGANYLIAINWYVIEAEGH